MMIFTFIFGTVFGSMLFFMARIANVKLETILEHVVKPQSISRPLIVMPTVEKKPEPTTFDEALQQALAE